MNGKNPAVNWSTIMITAEMKNAFGFFEKHKIITAIVYNWYTAISLFLAQMDVVTFPKK
tara:strand:- start:294 stop:470 length:177 start_codon:yes stop_codon:yes gene_type:complete